MPTHSPLAVLPSLALTLSVVHAGCGGNSTVLSEAPSSDGTLPASSGSSGGAGGSGGASLGAAPRTPPGEGESETLSSFAALGIVPFDVNRDDLVGPTAHDAQYGRIPALVAVPGPDFIDVAVTSPTEGNATAIVRLRADQAGQWGVTRALRPETLGRLMGLARTADDQYFYATGSPDEGITATSPADGEHRPNVARLLKLRGSGAVSFDKDLDVGREGANLVRPMAAATARLAANDLGVYLIHGGNTAADANGTRHQKSFSSTLDPATGEFEKQDGVAWVSHSFDQRILTDGPVMYVLELGDAYARGIMVNRLDLAAKTGTTLQSFAIKGNTGDNNTFSRLGSLVKLPDGRFFAAFATEREPGLEGSGKIYGTREFALVRFSVDAEGAMKVDETFGETQTVQSGGERAENHVAFLTSYATSGPKTLHVERPRLVPLESGELLALYEKWSLDEFQGIFAQRIDAQGAVQKAETAVGPGHLPRGDDAFVFQGKVGWVTGDKETRKLSLHFVDRELVRTDHDVL